VSLVLYTRRGCRLCEEAEEMLAFSGRSAALIDVDDDIAIRDRYGLRVPVLEADGRIVMEGKFDEAELARRLSQPQIEAPADEGVGEAGG
jgi:hypothetical protein